MTTNIILVALAFLSVSTGVLLHKKRRFLLAFIAIGVLLFIAPFVLHRYHTRNAYEWTIVAERTVEGTDDPQVIFIHRIEWITNYEVLTRQRGHVRSVSLDGDTVRKVWHVRGYEPVAIRAEIVYGHDEIALTRNFSGLEPGAYTFTLAFDVNDEGSWSFVGPRTEGGDE